VTQSNSFGVKLILQSVRLSFAVLRPKKIKNKNKIINTRFLTPLNPILLPIMPKG